MSNERSEKIVRALVAVCAVLWVVAVSWVAAGCKSVTVETAEWRASYTCVGQQNDVKGLKVSAGKNVALEVGETKSALDPAVQDALRSAAAALNAACRACEEVAR